MKRTSAVFTILCCLLVYYLWLHAAPVHAHPVSATELDAGRINWISLKFKAKSFFATVENDIELKNIAATEVEKFLIASPTGKVLNGSGPDLFCVVVSSVIEPITGGSEYILSQAWYDPKPATVLQRVRLRQGQEKWQKTYRFTDRGVFRMRKKPKSPDEAAMSVEHWTDSEGSFYAYGTHNDGCLPVLEPSILLYIASVIDPDGEEQPLSFYVFNKKQLHQVQMHRAGVNRIKVDFRAKSGEREVRRKEEIQALKLAFKTRSLAEPNEEPEPFSFLGLQGDFDLYIDKASRIPIQVSGKISKFGKVDIRLQKAELRRVEK